MKRNNNLLVLALILFAVCLSCFFFGTLSQIETVDTFGEFGEAKQDNFYLESVACDTSGKEKYESESFSEHCADLVFGEKPQPLQEKVFVGGNALGLSFDGEGAVVIGINEFMSKSGVVSPAATSGINIGDTIKEFNGVAIYNSSMLSEQLQIIKEKSVKIKIKRGQVVFETDITPKYDVVSKAYKLGLWLKDASSGIGTLTFCRQNGGFGSLGHPITDSKTGQIIKVDEGNVYTCKILSIEKGEKGKAGEVRGIIDNQNHIGTILDNNKFGVYGTLEKELDYYSDELYEVASTRMVKAGKAQIVCALDGVTPKAYDIEIVKASFQSGINDKGMVIKVTDPKLLELTGGIVQGMSGSPILQNGRLVGAVTHVFVNEPTKGYGIYAEWMLKTLDNLQQS